jgi:MFS family permease
MVGFWIQAVAWGVSSTFGIFFTPLLTEFGWSRAAISGASSLSFLIFGFLGIFAGRLSDKIGPRIVMVGCGVFLGAGYLLMSQVNTVWQLYLFYAVILAFGWSGVDIVLLSTVAKWFSQKRGMMSGILKVGTGVGMLVMPLVANWLISSYGWRDSYIILGGIVMSVVIPAALFLRRDPAQMGLLPDGADASSLNSAEGGFSLQEAIHTRRFWILCAMSALAFFSTMTIIVHIVPHAIDLDITAATAASILATIGGVSMAGRFVMGTAGDRIGSRLAMAICFIILVVALVWLQSARELWMLYLFAAIYGFAHGGFFALLSPLVAELFGLSSHGAIFGTVYFIGTIGGAIGPLLAGRIFDVTGNYQLAFLISAVVSGIALILTLLLRSVGKERR